MKKKIIQLNQLAVLLTAALLELMSLALTQNVNHELLSVLLLDQLQKIRNEGLILKDTDGPGCHKITVNSAGTITATAVTCP
jgi:hypothetical protein